RLKANLNIKFQHVKETCSTNNRLIFNQQFQIVLCKPYYTRLCESDVKVKKANIALFKLLFIGFLRRNYTGINHQLH
ncbi:hypothetical protein D5Q68_25050, partial [Escherichia coli]|nr:hypothetical protein [Escherichia coli]